jgi:hypothetical protein
MPFLFVNGVVLPRLRVTTSFFVFIAWRNYAGSPLQFSGSVNAAVTFIFNLSFCDKFGTAKADYSTFILFDRLYQNRFSYRSCFLVAP